MNDFGAWPLHQMISIGQNRLPAAGFDLFDSQRLDGCFSAANDESWRLNRAVRRFNRTSARQGAGEAMGNAESDSFLHLF